MEKNRVNGCGRTELLSNIDVAEETEQALKDNTFAKVKAGDTLQGLMHVVNRDGGGNNKCTLDETNNAGQFVKVSGRELLTKGLVHSLSSGSRHLTRRGG